MLLFPLKTLLLLHQVVRGEAADLALHKAGGFIKGRDADMGMWRDVASPEKMVKRSGNYVSITGDTGRVFCDVGVDTALCNILLARK
jgi:hypothetical protein